MPVDRIRAMFSICIFSDQQFLLYDSRNAAAVPRGCKLLIFASPEGLEDLGRLPHLFVDGTFSSVPSMFTQLVTIHALVGGRTFPVVFSLLGNKAASTYKVMWEVCISYACIY